MHLGAVKSVPYSSLASSAIPEEEAKRSGAVKCAVFDVGDFFRIVACCEAFLISNLVKERRNMCDSS